MNDDAIADPEAVPRFHGKTLRAPGNVRVDHLPARVVDRPAPRSVGADFDQRPLLPPGRPDRGASDGVRTFAAQDHAVRLDRKRTFNAIRSPPQKHRAPPPARIRRTSRDLIQRRLNPGAVVAFTLWRKREDRGKFRQPDTTAAVPRA